MGCASSSRRNKHVLPVQGIAKTVTKQRIESHFDLELRAAVMVRFHMLPLAIA